MKTFVLFTFCAIAPVLNSFAATTPILSVTDGANYVAVDATGAVVASSGVVDVLSNTASSGTVHLSAVLGAASVAAPGVLVTATGTTKPVASGSDLLISALNLSAGSVSITGRFTDIGYISPGQSSLSGGGSGFGTFSFSGYINTANAACVVYPPIPTCAGTKLGPLTSAGTIEGPGLTTAPYSLTAEVILQPAAGHLNGGDFDLNVDPPGTGCPATKGYWKNAAKHPFPSMLMFPVSIGGISYTSADFYTILGLDGSGNAVAIMGSQLVAALLNLAAGGESNSTILSAITAAEGYVSGINMTTGFVSPNSSLGQKMLLVEFILNAYNNGFFWSCQEGAGLN